MRLTLLLLFFIQGITHAQKHTISGFIKDGSSGESLIGSTVINLRTKTGTATNVHGFYSLTQPKDSVVLVYSYVGYQPQTVKLILTKDTTLNISLNFSTLDEIVIQSSKADPIHEKNEMSTIVVPTEQIKAMPAFLGETDVLKALQLLPGVQSGNKGSTGLYVRGGGPDQNLILLDGVPIYNASHLFGFFSVFNADAINHVELVKGGFPARYGGRLSSVIDINMKDGNLKEVKGEGSVGIISARATVEGPIQKDRTSFLVSARRTYLDLLARPFIKSASNNNVNAGYFFYDLNMKISQKVNSKNFIYASSYLGNDKAYADYRDNANNPGYTSVRDEEYGLNWGNVISALRWKKIISPKLFSNLTATYSRYQFAVFSNMNSVSTPPQLDDGETKDRYSSGIHDLAAKAEFDFVPNTNHYMRWGLNFTNHKFSPGVYTYRSQSEGDSTIGAYNIGANELFAFIEDDIKVSNALKINVGSHYSAFRVNQRWYQSWQPRISTRLLLGQDWSVKSSYAKMTQYIHLLTNAGIGLPTDLWVPSTANILPQQSDQVALGFAKTYKRMFEFTLEGYYKIMENLIEYKDGASYANIEEDWQNKVAKNGRGRSYGIEVLLQKKTGALTGWLGYTWSKSLRQFDEINSGKWFPYRYDRRHDISLTLSHTWNDRMDFSMAWVFGTGNAISLPSTVYEGQVNGNYLTNSPDYVNYGIPIYLYESRNDYRMRSYHRMDLSFSFWKNKKWGQRKWTIAVYNAYNRLNPFFVEIGENRMGQKKLIQYSLFPIIPSITYGFKF